MTTNVDNLNINYYDSLNNKDIILFLHGWGSNYKIFEFLFPYLENKYRIIALDLPGFGESSEPKTSNFVLNFLTKL